MKKSAEIRQAISGLKEEMRGILAKAESEKRALTDSEKAEFDVKKAEALEMEQDAARYEAAEDVEGRSTVKGKVQVAGNINDELRQYIKTGEARALSTSVNKDGGYAVIPEVDTQIMQRLADDSVIRSIATVVTTGTNEYKKLVSTGGAKVAKGTEGVVRAVTDTPGLAEVSIKLFANYALPTTSREIVDFADVDILGWLNTEIVETLAEVEETEFTSGTGPTDKKAQGFLSATRDTKPDSTRDFGTLQKLVAASDKAIAGDELIDLFYSLRAKYRSNAVWVMNSSTAALCQKIKDKNDNYIWREGLTIGAPATLLGRPIVFDEAMESVGKSKAVIAVGDFKRGYYVVDHSSGIQTLPDQYSKPGLIQIHTTKYTGGAVVDSNAIKILEMSATVSP